MLNKMTKLLVIALCCVCITARVANVDFNIAGDLDNTPDKEDIKDSTDINSINENDNVSKVTSDNNDDLIILINDQNKEQNSNNICNYTVDKTSDTLVTCVNNDVDATEDKIDPEPDSQLTHEDPKIKIDLPTYSDNQLKHEKPKIKLDLPTYSTVKENENLKKCSVGEPLILTPLIKKGNAKQARSASKVDPGIILGLESYSGFLTVNETYNSNLFFWFFPAPGKPLNETPWIIWLQGGPGVSSMIGLFDEIGPIIVDSTSSLKLRNDYWGKEHSLLFIENPVGTGFSFTDNILGYAHHVNESSPQLYDGVQQFLQMFPELRQAPLFIAGESYAGKYIPGLAMEIHNHKNTNVPEINFQGLAIGNGFIEAKIFTNISRVMYNFGMIDNHQRDRIQEIEREYLKLVEANESIAAKEKWMSMLLTLFDMTKQNQFYNLIQDDRGIAEFESFLGKPDVRKAIHVGAVPFSSVDWTVNEQLRPDFLTSARPQLETLLEHYRVMLYSGQLDELIPYVLSAENYRTWRWSGSELFAEAERRVWHCDSRAAGYYKSGGNLTEVLVRAAGHTVPMDQPGASVDLITRFVRNQTLTGHIVKAATSTTTQSIMI